MKRTVSVSRVATLPAEINTLVEESQQEGFAFLARLLREWESGENRFAAMGEALFVAHVDDAIVGVCGLNIDPFVSEAHVGRLRHFYVSRRLRRRGVGQALLQVVIEHAVGHGFRQVRLRTDSVDAAHFYEHRGFSSAVGLSATHVLEVPA